MTGRLTTLGEALRELEAAAAQTAVIPVVDVESVAAPAAPSRVHEDRVRRKLALLRSIGVDGTFTLRAAIRPQPAAKAAR